MHARGLLARLAVDAVTEHLHTRMCHMGQHALAALSHSTATAFSGANCYNSEFSFSSGRKSLIVVGASLKRYIAAIALYFNQ